ncbi:Extracellular protein [Lactobacillus kullabergensis]|uniref:Extracellular protein n=1 Tax=Lactobacillus kullabergensis TaxID=1218493 RepID=A0A0F4LNF3_9LACO|nr:Extracellular protein [Lactobacillus kullabergensis]
MKKAKTFSTIITLLFFGMLMCDTFTQTVKADELPVVCLGTSLTASQRSGTLKTLSEPLNGSSYQTITITGEDLVKYLNPSGANFTTHSGVWSSAMIEKAGQGNGINVHILDYQGRNNITTITADQYKNAALTAGISDANIYVTSAVPIDGSGALAGVYAAYNKTGENLNQNQVNAAQDEMNTLSKITKENQDKSGYSDAQLNNAVAGAKQEMGKIGNNVSDSQIHDIVNNQININHLGDVINNNQKQQIINVLIEVRDSGALKNHKFKDQADALSKNIKKNAKGIFDKINTPENRNWFEQIWHNITSFFSNLFSGLIIVNFN